MLVKPFKGDFTYTYIHIIIFQTSYQFLFLFYMFFMHVVFYSYYASLINYLLCFINNQLYPLQIYIIMNLFILSFSLV